MNAINMIFLNKPGRYCAYYHPIKGWLAIKHGWSWPAAILGFVWAAYHRLWILSFVSLAVVISFSAYWANAIDELSAKATSISQITPPKEEKMIIYTGGEFREDVSYVCRDEVISLLKQTQTKIEELKNECIRLHNPGLQPIVSDEFIECIDSMKNLDAQVHSKELDECMDAWEKNKKKSLDGLAAQYQIRMNELNELKNTASYIEKYFLLMMFAVSMYYGIKGHAHRNSWAHKNGFTYKGMYKARTINEALAMAVNDIKE